MNLNVWALQAKGYKSQTSDNSHTLHSILTA